MVFYKLFFIHNENDRLKLWEMEEINEDQYVQDEFHLSESKTFFFLLYIIFYHLYLIVYIVFFFYLKRKKNIFLVWIYQSINSFLKSSPFTY